ncbi:MAG: hypothetical protein OSJ61_01995 [Lachnospiraceae bacterium]|nr:hypothetical protein [Lachnospiraceae bacterium]
MSRFHFDESTADTVTSSFCGIIQNIRDCVNALNNISMELCDYEGFNIGYAIESINDEKNVKFRFCINSLERGYNVLNYVKERVSFYGQLAASQRNIDTLKYIENNSRNGKLSNIFREYNSATAHFTDKYCYNFGTVVSQIKTSFVETFKNGSYEKYLIKKTIRDLIATTSGDYKFSNPAKDFMKFAGNKDLLFSAFDEKYPKSGFLKYAKEADYDVKIIALLMNDYSDNMEYLNSLERSLLASGFDSKVLTSVMNDLRSEYDDKYLAACKKVSGDSIEKLVSVALENNPIGATVITTLDILELVDDKSTDKMDYVAIKTYESDAMLAYASLGKKSIVVTI